MLRKVADGGMAEIYLAKQTGEEGFSRLVIVKRILPAYSQDPHFRDMLLDEAHIAMSLNHSNVVPVLDLGRADGSYFLVMELVDGWDLANIYDRGRAASFALPLGLALYIMAETCRGLGYAHGRRDVDGRPLGIVHRDVSPHNVLVSEHGEVKVTDFGIAKALGKRDRTQTGLIKGKLDFMSPEQASGAALDASSDIFAAGTTLYLLVTGRRPFASPSDMEALLRVQKADFLPPEEVRPGISPAVAGIVKRAMRARPSERYRTADEMMLDLEAVLRDEFGSPGQSQLKRWLAELTDHDGVLPLSRRPGMAAPPPTRDSLSSRWFAEGEMLSFEDSSKISGMTASIAASRGAMPAASAGFSMGGGFPSSGSGSMSGGASLGGGSMAPSLGGGVAGFTELPPRRVPVAPGASSPGMSRGGSRYLPRWASRSYLAPPPRRRRFLRRAALVVLLLAMGGLAASQLLPPQQKEKIQEEARTLVERGVKEVTSVIQQAAAPARPEPLDEKLLGGTDGKDGATAAVPGEEDARKKRSRRETTVTLVSNPPGAEVVGPSGKLGVTPMPFTLRVGSTERLTFRKDGYAEVERRVTGRRKETTVTVDLTPQSAAR